MSVIACYDAGDVRSYAGGTTWRDISGRVNDITHGGSDPVFYGDYGRLSVGERWRFSGAGRFTAAANPAELETFHKNNAKHTIIVWAKLAGGSAQGLVGNNAADATGSTIGFAFRTTAGSLLHWYVSNGVPGITSSIAGPDVTSVIGIWAMFSVSVDEATPLTTFGVNTTFNTSAAAYASPSSASATYPFQIGAAGNNVGSLASGTELGSVIIDSGIARSQAELTNIYNDSKSRWGL